MKRISIIICCFNSAARLGPTLSAIFAADLRYVLEVVVVDNGSTDQTKSIAATAGEFAPVPVVCIEEKRSGLAYARAAGVKASKGEIISFLDDDNEVTINWFERVNAGFEGDLGIGAIGGRVLPPNSDTLPKWFDSVAGNFAVGEQAPGSGYVTTDRMLLWGAGLSVRRSAVGNFYDNPDGILLIGRRGQDLLAGDDTELCYWIILSGYELFYDKEMILRHNLDISRISWRHVLQLNIGFGRARFRLFPYHVRLKKGRLSRYRFFHSQLIVLLLACADLFLAALRMPFSPSLPKLARVANCYGYLLENAAHIARPARGFLKSRLGR